jgi:dolichyl-phosphate-mannose-protein mannosyltransferase
VPSAYSCAGMTAFTLARIDHSRHDQRDPARWCAIIAAAFFLLVMHRLGIPSRPMFDEIHYLPAARRLIDLSSRLNPEHPLVGKQLIAWSMQVFGDNPMGWRVPSALLGSIGLWAMMRAIWWASLSRTATVLFGLLLATDFIWFMMSRIALLDMAMAGFMALAMWQWALAWRNPLGRVWAARLHLMLTGLFLGISLGGKWNGALLVPLPGLLFALNRWEALKGRRTGLLWASSGAGPVPGVSLIEAAVWLGVVPVLAYFATFLPAFYYVGFWAINGKPVQFYYHYMLASCFLIAALALWHGGTWGCAGQQRLRWCWPSAASGSTRSFQAELPRKNSFLDYTWIEDGP